MTSESGDPNALLASTLADIVGFAVEHETNLDLMSLIAYLDLYQQHVSSRGEEIPAPFERFVRDADLLGEAAAERTRESGVPTAARVFPG